MQKYFYCFLPQHGRRAHTLFLRISKKTVTFALDKVFQTPSAVLNEEYLLSDIAIVDCIWLYFYLVWYKVCYGISFQYCTLPVIIIIFFRIYTACLAHLNARCIHFKTFSTRKCVTIFAIIEMSPEKISVDRDVTETRNGERGTGNGERGTEV